LIRKAVKDSRVEVLDRTTLEIMLIFFNGTKINLHFDFEYPLGENICDLKHFFSGIYLKAGINLVYFAKN